MTDTVISSATREVVIGFERPFVIIGEAVGTRRFDILRTGRPHKSRLNHTCYSYSHATSFGHGGVPMTKHRRITGFVIVALLAVVATTANVRSHSHSTGLLTASPAMSPGELTVAMKNLPTEDFDDQSLIFPRGTNR